MKKERLVILNMVHEGKISADDAAKLLGAIGANQESNAGEDFAYELEEKFAALTKSLEGFAKVVNTNVKETYKGMEPKLKTATKTVVAKTACVVDEISKTLNESLKNMENQTNNEEDGNCCCGGKEENCCSEENDDTPKEN